MGSISPEHDRPAADRVNLHVVEPTAGSIAVLLCCAEADADAVASRIEQIEAADVRVISGLEHDTVALRDELAAMTHQSLVVVCKTDALGTDAVRRAVECFGLRRTWTHRLLVLELASRHSSSWIGSVHRTLAAMQRRRSRPVDRIDPGPVRGEIIGSVREAPNAPSPDAPAVVLSDDEPNILRDDVGPIPAHVRAPGKRPSHLALVLPVADDSDDDTLSSISDACLIPPVVAAANTPAPRRPRYLLPAVFAAILGGAIVGTLWLPADRTIDLAVVASEDASAVTSVASESPATPPRTVISEALLAPHVSHDVMATAEDKPELSETDVAIENAIEAGLAERHGAWVVWKEAEPATDWWAAANLCRQRPLAGIRGWRLPTLTEARALRRAGGLPSVDSWTLTRAADREGNWVASADGRFDARDKHDASGYAACIRK